jgi:hypothetical protein
MKRKSKKEPQSNVVIVTPDPAYQHRKYEPNPFNRLSAGEGRVNKLIEEIEQPKAAALVSSR